MNIEEYLDYMKEIQNKLEEFIDEDNNSDANLPNLLDIINDKKNRITSQHLKTFFYIIVKIANNHKRCPNFYNKIESVLSNFKEDIKKYSNFEVFQIFSSNKRILLFLIKEDLLHFDEEIAQIIIRGKYNEAEYHRYLEPEIKLVLKTNVHDEKPRTCRWKKYLEPNLFDNDDQKTFSSKEEEDTDSSTDLLLKEPIENNSEEFN